MTYNDCTLYKLESKKMLKYYLRIPSNSFFDQKHISTLIHPYLDIKSGKIRLVESPERELKLIQKRLKSLLQQLPVPEYVFSGIKGRSYIDNAKYHIGDNYLYKIDIVAFFPNIPRESVYKFFINKLNTSSDVAEVLTNITTVDLNLVHSPYENDIKKHFAEKGIKYNNHLGTGFPTSSILSYHVVSDMFNLLYDLSIENGMIMTVYIDDVTFSSSNNISFAIREKIKNIIKQFGYKIAPKKIKYYTRNYPKRITGVIINSQGKVDIPNSLRYKIIRTFRELEINNNIDTRNKLRGLLVAARQINPNAYPAIYKYLYS